MPSAKHLFPPRAEFLEPDEFQSIKISGDLGLDTCHQYRHLLGVGIRLGGLFS